MISGGRAVSWASATLSVPPSARVPKTVSISGVVGSRLCGGRRGRWADSVGVTGGGAMERTSRPLCGLSDLSRGGSTCTFGIVSSALTESGPDLAVDFR